MDSSELKKLLHYIQEGKAIIHFVLSMPRTRSTALHLALSHSPDINGQICHPMNNGIFAKSQQKNFRFEDFRDDLDDITGDEIARRVNQVVDPLLERGVANIIINEHAKFISLEHLPLLPLFSKTFIFSIRDPRVQILSHMMRCINECFLSENCKDNRHCFDVDNILDLIQTYTSSEDALSQKLEYLIQQKPIDVFRGDIWHRYTGGREALNDVPPVKVFVRLFNFVLKEIEATWDNTSNTLAYLLRSGNKIITVDSEAFIQRPDTVLHHVTSQLSIDYSEAMSSQWRTNTREKFVCFIYTKDEEKDNAWSGPAVNSTRVTTSNDSTRGRMLDSTRLPGPLVVLLAKADVIYRTLLTYSKIE